MLKGKQLYTAARAYVDDEIMPMLEQERKEGPEVDKETNEVKDKGIEIGLALLVDVAESLHKIAIKVG